MSQEKWLEAGKIIQKFQKSDLVSSLTFPFCLLGINQTQFLLLKVKILAIKMYSEIMKPNILYSL